MSSRSMRVAAADYELAAARAAAEDRPIARIVGAAIRHYCAAETGYVEPAAPLGETYVAGVRDELEDLGLREQLQAKIDAIGKGVKVAAEESLHAGRVPPSNGPPPVSVGDHSLTNDSSAACPPHPKSAERVLAWGVVCGACGKKIR